MPIVHILLQKRPKNFFLLQKDKYSSSYDELATSPFLSNSDGEDANIIFLNEISIIWAAESCNGRLMCVSHMIFVF